MERMMEELMETIVTVACLPVWRDATGKRFIGGAFHPNPYPALASPPEQKDGT